MINKVITIVNMAMFVHVPGFGRAYNWCVIHKAIVDAMKGLGYKLKKKCGCLTS